ncbi:hypothetical protein ACFQL1_16015 [Halomicroarcula sp. GCM10025709]|uniref:hypothetical protein n=1 Tax=Haloarcula TaxID=2237 RepID=UPI0024C22414|nr:hypothetical protein [Halomicroarcula sp. YJ-61-S]
MSLSQKTRERIDDSTALIALSLVCFALSAGLLTGTLTLEALINLLDAAASSLESLP